MTSKREGGGMLDDISNQENIEVTIPPPRRLWSPRSDDGSRKWSPSRWSPSRLSPASRQRYDALQDGHDVGSTDERRPSNKFKSSSAPTTPVVVPKAIDFETKDLPSPAARSRHSPMDSTGGTGLRTQSLPPQKSRKHNQSSPSPPSKKDPEVFRFTLQTSGLGTEAILPGHSRIESLKDSEDDDFDMLIKERHDSSRKTPFVFADPPAPIPILPRGGTAGTPTSKTGTPDRTSSLRFHQMCATMTSQTDILQAQAYLKNHPGAAAAIDNHGRTALHVLSTNKMLASAVVMHDGSDDGSGSGAQILKQASTELEGNQLEKQVLQFIVEDLLPANPDGLMIKDGQNMLPFEMALSEWITEHQEEKPTNIVSALGFPYAGAMNNVWESTAKFARLTSNALSSGFAMMDASPSSKAANNMERGESRNAIFSPVRFLGSIAGVPFSSNDRDGGFQRKVQLTPQARFSLQMLSTCLDEVEHYQQLSKSAGPRVDKPRTDDRAFLAAQSALKDFEHRYGSVNVSATVAETMASLPDILMTILIIDDDTDRTFALSSSFVRRLMLSKSSVGPWLTKMLQSSDRTSARRAVDYLKLLSDELTKCESSMESVSSSTRPSAQQSSAQLQMRSQHQLVIDEISRLQDFIPSLLGLNDRGIEEASTTYIVKQVSARMVSRPFALTIIICDMIFLAVLIIGFRYAVNKMIEGASTKTVLQWIYVANSGIFYFLIREIGKTVSFMLISSKARRYFLSSWYLIDAISVTLALISTIAMRYNFTIMEKGIDDNSLLRGLLAITTGLLWLRVLSLLKAINTHLATFVLAIIQITKDIAWFCVILVTLVISFSQMFFTLLASSSCATEEGKGDDMKCKPTEYMLRVYTILLGDFGNFERKQFVTAFSVFLVVVYSFLVTVILLNVLIAVASDSYERCLLRSQHLFGRARVMLVAELVAFQNLLQKVDRQTPQVQSGLYSCWGSSGRVFQNWSRASVLFFSLSVLLISIWTVAELIGYAAGERDATYFSLASVVANGVFFVVITAFLAMNSRESDSPKENTTPSGEDGLVLRFMLQVLGVSKRSGSHYDERKGEWNGRVDYLEFQMRSIAEEQNELLIRQAKALENLVNQTELRLKAEMEALENNFSLLRDGVLNEVKVTKRTNEFVAHAVQELKTIMSVASSTEYQPPVPVEVNVERARRRSIFTEDQDK